MATAKPQLITFKGELYFKSGSIILCIYDEGDCDTIKWPKPNAKNLRRALFDARETGDIDGDAQSVLLPDGTEFDIESADDE